MPKCTVSVNAIVGNKTNINTVENIRWNGRKLHFSGKITHFDPFVEKYQQAKIRIAVLDCTSHPPFTVPHDTHNAVIFVRWGATKYQ